MISVFYPINASLINCFRKTGLFFFSLILLHFSGYSQNGAMINNAGVPAEVVLTPYKTTLLADGKDESVIKVTFVDRQGKDVENADNEVQFLVNGDAKIVRIESGASGKGKETNIDNQNAKEASYKGICRVILQAGKTPGHIKFKASSKGLWDGSTDIFTVNANQEINTS